MNDNGFLYNLERAQAGPVDEEALARKMAARTAVWPARTNPYSRRRTAGPGNFRGRPGYYYFADSDEGQYVIVEAIGEDGGLEIYYSGSEIAFPPEGMDGKWKPVPCLASVCGREAEEEEAFRKGTALPSQARNIRNSARRLETFPPVFGLFLSVSPSFFQRF